MLAVHIRASIATDADPFGKVKGMIQEMIEKLVKEAAEEAEHKAFCDKEMSETKAKMEDKQGEVDDLSTKIEKLKEEVATLEKELMKIADEQKVANEMREAEKTLGPPPRRTSRAASRASRWRSRSFATTTRRRTTARCSSPTISRTRCPWPRRAGPSLPARPAGSP